MNAEGFARWVASSSWRVAKTMPEIPHEYVVLAHDRQTFKAIERFIVETGFRPPSQMDQTRS